MTKLPDGLYDLLVTQAIERELSQLGNDRRHDVQPLEPADSHLLLARYIADVVREALRGMPEAERPARQAEICNELLSSIAKSLPDAVDPADSIDQPPRRLAAVYRFDPLKNLKPASPEIPLGQSDLLVNARGEPRAQSVIEREIDSADRIDLIIAFIRWSGLRLFESRLRAFTERGGELRVITTTYTGSTERRAIEHLISMGARVKVSYQTDNTRLHAKAWLFHRHSGFSTVFIGSSNLSTSAMLDGVEWNVRLSKVDAPTIVEKFAATFDSYWADADYELYDPLRDAQKFDRAVAKASEEGSVTFVGLQIEPWPHQREMLEQLTVERYRHNRWRNLIVAATGTGKTLVAAFDYRRLCEEIGRPLSLLFVAHRREILKQSVDAFRHVMRDGSFGELYVDGQRPDEWKQVFASIQSLSALGVETIRADAFDVVIVDEFHHAAAPTYDRLLGHLKPPVLLGLTATPERTDGQSVLPWFNGRIAVELRLWEALDRGLLSPFHYFGIHDNVDISYVAWKRGRYDEKELENVYTGNDARVVQIVQQLSEKVSDLQRMRALGFCVGVHHAEFMAARFRDAGISAEAVLGTTDSQRRDDALRRLKNGDIKCLFAVDIFNEGVDVPEVDTVLFLRPTESALIFLQQLGRGLRRLRDKQCLTVLDFIGNANRNFRFDLRYRALTGASRREIEEEITNGFPYLPAGCAIQLDRESSRIVLDNLKQSIGSNFKSFVGELKGMTPPVSLAHFLREAAIEPEELYRNSSWSWTRLKREALPGPVTQVADKLNVVNQDERRLLGALGRILHIDDEVRLALFRDILTHPQPPDVTTLDIRERRMVEGLMLTLWTDEEREIQKALDRLWHQDAVRMELAELLDVLDDRAAHRTFALADELPDDQTPTFEHVPLQVHARYTRDEVLAAIGRSTLAKPFSHREGPLSDKATNTDYFFVTLEKSEKYYSPSTRYRDYAVSPDVFHWESQSQTPENSPTGQRYINHEKLGSNVMLLVRSRNKDASGRTVPFTFLGPATYIEHRGERPMAILWRLHRPMPLDFFSQAKVVAG
jgi:superfamily II DNA or RNA helicase